VTCIQSAGDPADFGDRVTEYRNNQNAVRTEDFIALDDNQENWRKTLQVSGIRYIYKPSAQDPHAAERVFTAQEAANYLACASKDGLTWAEGLQLVIADSGALWDQKRNFVGASVNKVEDSVYGCLFPNSLTARRLWRTTQIGRMIRDIVDADIPSLSPAEAALQKTALYLILNLVFSRQRHLCDGITLNLTAAEREAISKETEQVRIKLSEVYGNENWADAEPATVLADLTNMKRLKGLVMMKLAA
jgi:hypothetical protein